MPQSAVQTEHRINELIGESTEYSDQGDWAAAIGCQRHAVDLAGSLVVDDPGDERLRHGLGGLLYRLGSLHLAGGDPAAAVTALDVAEQTYAGLVGAVTDAELLHADVLARRGLAQSVRGRAASASIDADQAVLVYLSATGGDPTSELRRDLARTLAMNAATLAPDGDPQMAIASANAALGYYGYSAASVSALLNFAHGRVVEGFLPAAVLAAGLPPDEQQQRL